MIASSNCFWINSSHSILFCPYTVTALNGSSSLKGPRFSFPLKACSVEQKINLAPFSLQQSMMAWVLSTLILWTKSGCSLQNAVVALAAVWKQMSKSWDATNLFTSSGFVRSASFLVMQIQLKLSFWYALTKLAI